MVNERPYIVHCKHIHHIQFLTTGSVRSVLSWQIQHIHLLVNGSVGSDALTLVVADNPLFQRTVAECYLLALLAVTA